MTPAPKHRAMQFDIIALGEPLYELNQQPDGRYLPGFGGDTSNVAIAAARLGSHCAYIGKLGNDSFGDAIAALWAKEGVDASAVACHATAQTGLYLVTHGERGHQFSYYRKGSAASLMTPEDVPAELFARAKYLHVSGISQAISETASATVFAAIEAARKAKVAVSYDTNLRTRLWPIETARPAIEKAAALSSLTKTSIEDAEALLGLTDPSAIAAHFLKLGAGAVIVTLGAKGVYVATSDTRADIAGFKVAAVDATGAGDAFTGALLSELSRGVKLLAAARFANAAAALSTLGYGAVEPLPRRSAVEAFLAKHQSVTAPARAHRP
jgi:2-dehydro-3-deoxygluconokinase